MATKKTKYNFRLTIKNTSFFHESHLLTVCCDLVTDLYKDSKKELRAELLHSLGHRLLVVTMRCLFLDFLC